MLDLGARPPGEHSGHKDGHAGDDRQGTYAAAARVERVQAQQPTGWRIVASRGDGRWWSGVGRAWSLGRAEGTGRLPGPQVAQLMDPRRGTQVRGAVSAEV
ncbi:hypothetical protein GCM10010201_29780 [Pilimelia columellifera subsp. columellifera]|uniref:Uncharacterized protein n=1 Tax=Pilimelia columellifera subsp. columellifera TaxID=706583 RepID=A0ABP6AYW1_9ACTN